MSDNQLQAALNCEKLLRPFRHKSDLGNQFHTDILARFRDRSLSSYTMYPQ